MLAHLALRRPLAVLDLETTGVDTATDRIVEISVLRIAPDGRAEHRTRRVNPGVPIPPGATAVHGIRDEDVAGEPPFAALAPGVVAFLDGCDLAGFNLKRYDLRLLLAELRRAGLTLPLAGRAVLDPLEIFRQREPRDLTAAVRHYLGRDHAGAHGAAADVLATLQVLDAQVGRYDDLPRSVEDLHAAFVDPEAVDFEGKFRRAEGRIVFAFGKYLGQALDDVAVTKPDYLRWMAGADFFDDAKALAREALGRAGR